MSCTPLVKAVKPALQLTQLPCLVEYVKFQFVYAAKSKMGSQVLLASTSSRPSSKLRMEIVSIAIFLHVPVQ